MPTSRGRSASTALTLLTIATARTVRTRDTFSSNLADNNNTDDKGSIGGVEPRDFSSLVDDNTNSALRPNRLFRALYNIQDTNPENDYNVDTRALATLTI